MDRSLLSQSSVIQASRKFVCVRLATYEDKEEAAFTKKLFGREIQNTTFTVLTPDKNKKLVRAARSPQMSFRSSDAMASSLLDIAAFYGDGKPLDEKTALPTTANLRLGLNIAAGDNRPLVLVYAKDEKELKKLDAQMRKLAWSKEHIGKYIYATSTNPKELAPISGMKNESGIYILQVDTFGQKASILAKATPGSDIKAWSKAMANGAGLHQEFSKNMRTHTRLGRQQGLFWETQIPVTDPMEAAARARLKRSITPKR